MAEWIRKNRGSTVLTALCLMILALIGFDYPTLAAILAVTTTLVAPIVVVMW